MLMLGLSITYYFSIYPKSAKRLQFIEILTVDVGGSLFFKRGTFGVLSLITKHDLLFKSQLRIAVSNFHIQLLRTALTLRYGGAVYVTNKVLLKDFHLFIRITINYQRIFQFNHKTLSNIIDILAIYLFKRKYIVCVWFDLKKFVHNIKLSYILTITFCHSKMAFLLASKE